MINPDDDYDNISSDMIIDDRDVEAWCGLP